MKETWKKNCIKYRNEPGIIPYLWCLQETCENEELVCVIYGETTPVGADFSLQSVPIRKLVSHQDMVREETVKMYVEADVEFPPITVIKRYGKYHVIEGNHRVNALVRMGWLNVGARVYHYRDVKRAYKTLRRKRKKEWEKEKQGGTENEQEVKEKGNA